MNFLKPILMLACPFGVLELSLRFFQLTPPLWVADTMAISLVLIGSGLIVNFLQRGKPAFFQDRSFAGQCSLKGSPALKAPFQGGDWAETLHGLFHDIRNYSSTLRANAQLLRRHSLTSSMLEPLGRMERSSAKIECLAKELVEVSSSTMLSHACSIGIPELIESCIQDHFSGEPDIFDLQAPAFVPPVEADFLKLERVFLNLFLNAREAGASRILVRVTPFPARLRISVEDDGEGCSVEQAGKLFRPWFTTRKVTGGTGLGLYMVKAILDAHGGSIRAESKNALVGKGSGMVFNLELPIAQSRSRIVLERASFGMATAEEAI